jgi:hypothetical protein
MVDFKNPIASIGEGELDLFITDKFEMLVAYVTRQSMFNIDRKKLGD